MRRRSVDYERVCAECGAVGSADARGWRAYWGRDGIERGSRPARHLPRCRPRQLQDTGYRYNATAAAQAEKRVLAWFRKHIDK